jgi:hypothetical protein
MFLFNKNIKKKPSPAALLFTAGVSGVVLLLTNNKPAAKK